MQMLRMTNFTPLQHLESRQKVIAGVLRSAQNGEPDSTEKMLRTMNFSLLFGVQFVGVRVRHQPKVLRYALQPRPGLRFDG
jgi:hypothetical protein